VPIHDQGYHRYAGSRAQAGTAWQVIAGAGIRRVLVQRKWLGLLLLAWLPFCVRAVQAYAAVNVPQAAMLTLSPSTYRDFLGTQYAFVFFLTIFIGAPLIAADRRANALQLYLSKPLTRWEYISGKLTVLFLLLLSVTFLPAILLLIVQVVLAGSFAFLRANFYLVPAITLFSLLMVLLASCTMLALSSLSNSPRFVAVMYTGLAFFTSALYNAVRSITGSSTFAWLSPNDALEIVGDAIFRQPARHDLPLWAAVIVVVGLIVASGIVLERRVRAVEVVS
jgi:ABC-2 type transport system permease protein